MNWTHLHLALNHVPVLGSLFLFLLLLVGLIRRSAEIKAVALWGFVALTVVSVPIKFTGDNAYEEQADASWLSQDRATKHEEAADQATTAIFLTGLVAAVGIVLLWKKRAVPTAVYVALAVVAGATFLLMIRTANLGGELRHVEIREKTTAIP